LIRLIAPKEADMKRLLWVAIFTVIVQAVIGILGWYAPEALPGQWLNRQGTRTTGTFGNPAVFSSTLIFFALLLYQQATQTTSGKVRVVLLSVFTLGFFGIFFTFSRGSWLAGAVVLLGLMLLYPKMTLRLTLITAVLGIILGSSLLVNEVSWARRRLNAEETAEGRIILLTTGLRMVDAKPLFGWGYGNYDLYDNQFKTAVGEIIVRSDSTSHNTYLTVMAEMGLIAFLFYIFPLVYWLLYSMRSWQWLPQRGFWSRRLLFMLWLVIVTHIVVSSFMDMIRFNEFGTTMFWLTLGLIASMVYPLQRSRELSAPQGVFPR
jgi:O-antigen ligase